MSILLLYIECLYYYDTSLCCYYILTKSVYFILICLLVCFIKITVCLVIGAPCKTLLNFIWHTMKFYDHHYTAANICNEVENKIFDKFISIYHILNSIPTLVALTYSVSGWLSQYLQKGMRIFILSVPGTSCSSVEMFWLLKNSWDKFSRGSDHWTLKYKENVML